MKKKISIFLIAALLPLLAWAGVSGIPSKPTFMQVRAFNSAPNGSTESITAVVSSKTDTDNGESARSARFAVVAHSSDLSLYNSTAVISLGVNGGTATANPSYVATRRWHMTKNGTAESGSNAGSDFEIQTFDDNGTHLFWPIKITRSTGVVHFEKSPDSTKACATGYTRISPNFCRRSTTTSFTALTRDTCTTDANLPTDAKMAVIQVRAYAASNNAAGSRFSTVAAHTGNTCATVAKYLADSTNYEFSAIVAGTVIGTAQVEALVALDGSQDFFLKFSDDGGNQGQASYLITGYFD